MFSLSNNEFLNLSVRLLKQPQTYYYGSLIILDCMPTKLIAVTAAAVTSLAATYATQPETLSNTIGIVIVSSAFSWATTELAHYVAHKMLEKKPAEREREKREIAESVKNQLDALGI